MPDNSPNFTVIDISEPETLHHQIQAASTTLGDEHSFDPIYDDYRAKGVDVGRMVFYKEAIEAYRQELLSRPLVKKAMDRHHVAVLEYIVEGTDNPIFHQPLVDAQIEDLESITPTGEDDHEAIILSETDLRIAKGICVIHGLNLGQAIRLAAKKYLDGHKKPETP